MYVHKAVRWMIVDFSNLLFEPLLVAGYTGSSQLAA